MTCATNKSSLNATSGVWESSYDKNIEIFIALWDVDFYYSTKENKYRRTISTKRICLSVIGYWKPPGALQWVPKCVTETVFKEKSPNFAMKMMIQYNEKDAGAIAIKFEVRETQYEYDEIGKISDPVGTVETTLGRLLETRSRGMALPIPFNNTCHDFNFSEEMSNLTPGQCYLRAEILHPNSSDDAVLLQFGLSKKSYKIRRYYLEIFKLNEDTLFELLQPYTLIHRSEILDFGEGLHYWHQLVIPLSRICNGNMERVVKLAVYDLDKPPGIPVGYALTTVRKLLYDEERGLKILQTKDGKPSQKLLVVVNQASTVQLQPLEYYFKKRLIVRRIFAVDYSRSNWNLALHKRSLHESVEGLPPYEEALTLTAKTVEKTCQEGDSVFYSFGNPNMLPVVASFEEKQYIESLMTNYKAGICCAKMAGLDLSENETRPSKQCIPITLKTPKRTTQLTPLLNDLMALISVREGKFEYYTAFVFTDGEISDLDQAMHVLIELAKLPVSIIFIAVGLGDLQNLIKLQSDWVHPVTRRYPCRKLTYLIHFRSLLDWNSSIQFSGRFVTSPEELFHHEIYNTLQKQIVKYMRIMYPGF